MITKNGVKGVDFGLDKERPRSLAIIKVNMHADSSTTEIVRMECQRDRGMERCMHL